MSEFKKLKAKVFGVQNCFYKSEKFKIIIVGDLN